MNRDLTVGKPGPLLWRFCLPLLGSVLFQQLYNIADSLVAGQFIGEEALAAVGNSYEITLIFFAFAFGCNMGCSVLVSQLFGAKRIKDMKCAVSTVVIFSAALCAILMAVGIPGAKLLLVLIQTPDNIMADSLLYLRIYLLGLPFLFFYNLSNGIFSALGDSVTPFIFLACSSVSNIFMDILFVAAFQMGVAGVAWATFLCQGVSCVLALVFVFRRLRGLKVTEHVPLFSATLLGQFICVAIPSFLQNSFVSVGNIVIQRVVNGFGSAVIAGYSASIKLNSLVITSFGTVANGVSNYTAQNWGAGKIDRVRTGARASIRMVVLIALPLAILYFTCAKWLVGLFIRNPSALALETGVQFLRIIAPFYFVVAMKMTFDGILRGAGRMTTFMIATFADLILRVGFALILSPHFDATGVWASWPIGWVVGTAISAAFYFTGPWNRRYSAAP
jgi:putative MATE family efflux protein